MAHFIKTPHHPIPRTSDGYPVVARRERKCREINGRCVAALRSARARKRVNRPITEHVRLHGKTNKQTTRP